LERQSRRDDRATNESALSMRLKSCVLIGRQVLSGPEHRGIKWSADIFMDRLPSFQANSRGSTFEHGHKSRRRQGRFSKDVDLSGHEDSHTGFVRFHKLRNTFGPMLFQDESVVHGYSRNTETEKSIDGWGSEAVTKNLINQKRKHSLLSAGTV
jgi:hypothetical protein